MKKFTKGCLITVLVLFLFGMAFWGVCGFMGGFAQLEERGLRKEGMVSIGWNGIRLGYDKSGFRFWDWDWDEDVVEDLGEDLEAALEDTGKDTLNPAELSEMTETDYQASEIRNLDIELGGCNFVIKESEDEFIWLQNDSSIKTVKYGMKNGTFKLEYGKTVRYWSDVMNNWKNNGTIYLYLPKDQLDLNTIDIEVGAGNMESIALEAKEIDIEAGAGQFIIEGIQADKVDVKVGAATADINKVMAGTLSIESGAGGIVVKELDVTDLDLKVGAGSIQITGAINDNVDIECSAGSVDMTLQGEETDYSYQIKCEMGSVQIGSNEYSGIDKEKYINNRAGKQMEIECSVGSVDIRFTGK